jgi:Arc/MetJ-type ribon-helix-helix transcriptional regulator
MNVTISDPKVIEYLRTAVESGRFPSAGEAVECAVALFQLEDSIELEVDDELRAKIQVGVDQLDRGEFSTYDRNQIWHEVVEKLGRKS